MTLPEAEHGADEIMAMISQAWTVGSPPPAVRAFVVVVIARAIEEREHAILERCCAMDRACYGEAKT